MYIPGIYKHRVLCTRYNVSGTTIHYCCCCARNYAIGVLLKKWRRFNGVVWGTDMVRSASASSSHLDIRSQVPPPPSLLVCHRKTKTPSAGIVGAWLLFPSNRWTRLRQSVDVRPTNHSCCSGVEIGTRWNDIPVPGNEFVSAPVRLWPQRRELVIRLALRFHRGITRCGGKIPRLVFVNIMPALRTSRAFAGSRLFACNRIPNCQGLSRYFVRQ